MNYLDLVSNYGAITELGKNIAKSGMFGCQTIDQGVVIAADCFLSNVSLMEYARRNKIVNGKPFKQYDSMLAEFHERGGDSNLISKTPELASIELEFRGTKKTFSISWEDAQQETFPYLGKEGDIVAKLVRGDKPELKPKYARPRSRAIMLFARVVSDAIRTMCPEVNYGVYTAEEIDDLPGESNSKPVAPSLDFKPPVPTPETRNVEATDESKIYKPAPEDLAPLPDAKGPITEEIVLKIREAVKLINQIEPDFSKRLKEKLVAAGVPDGKATGLSLLEGQQLLQKLEMREMDAIFSLKFDSREVPQ
jgi:hypothetical protein